MWPPSPLAEIAMRRLETHRHHYPFRHLKYEGAGHLILVRGDQGPCARSGRWSACPICCSGLGCRTESAPTRWSLMKWGVLCAPGDILALVAHETPGGPIRPIVPA